MLPDCEQLAARTALPLHRGPHRSYTEMVAERLGEIERRWTLEKRTAPRSALAASRSGFAEVQLSLRMMLLDPRRTVKLNRRDRLGEGLDFTALDAMADRLWQGFSD